MATNCHQCKHKRNIPGEAHIRCNKPDSQVMGKAYGIAHGCFYYPAVFDPVWIENECRNFEVLEVKGLK